MAEPGVAELLRRSVGSLREQVPGGYQRLLEELGGLTVELTVDGETFAVHAEGTRLRVVTGAHPAAGARVVTSRAAVLDVLDARLSLAEAVESDRVTVLGSLDDVMRAYHALLAYAHASARATSVPGLLDELRGAR
ncbi:hypothetical protein GCM10023321_84830 [Pseudonocardia eucalypti]|uniref:SCP-2 sterol transfer family protein n=1 Tax=Pseudonocardia eucalypti TaxID=648755 RepID=A0ABP9RGD7_9PSEU|nr:hypothetical protein [Pseudonocardia eucalypti]